MLIAKTLSWYKRNDVSQKLLSYAGDKEISIMFGLGQFGKRPNILQHEQDVLDFAKRRATSFHMSEEIWINPMMLNTGMSRKELDELRIGWDLILDIDCKYWPLAKLATHLFIQALKDHELTAITCKFSGNKGFHIAVPFQAFPKTIHGIEIKDWFPQGPQRIAKYLLDYITENKITITDEHVVLDKYKISWNILRKEIGLEKSDVVKEICAVCSEKKLASNKPEYACTKCGHTQIQDVKKEFINCPICKGIMKRVLQNKTCVCGSTKFKTIIDAARLIELDTLLISVRHSFRMPYSMHEKSELVSCPVKIDEILNFDRKNAEPERVDFSIPFLNRDVEEGQAVKLIVEAFDHSPELNEQEEVAKKEFEVPEQAISEDMFPPCIKKILSGLDDGKKRSQFVLQNFLKSVGWSHEMIEQRMIVWNSVNPEPIRETILQGSLRYAKMRKDVIPPPNCRNYYEELGVCFPDNLCQKIKNPVQYAKARYKMSGTKKSKPIKKHIKNE